MTYLEQRRKQKLGFETIPKEKVKEIANKKTPIKKRSKKMTRQMELYNLKRVKFLKLHPICPITGEPTTDIHHKAGRIGRLLLDDTYWLAVSRKGHVWIEEHPVESKKLGYSISRLNESKKSR